MADEADDVADDEVDDAYAYDRAARKFFGEFALTNFEEDDPSRGIPRATTSRFRGVSRDKARGRWAADIKKGGRLFRLGRFATEEDAARAYNRAAVEMFGESAKVNEGV